MYVNVYVMIVCRISVSVSVNSRYLQTNTHRCLQVYWCIECLHLSGRILQFQLSLASVSGAYNLKSVFKCGRALNDDDNDYDDDNDDNRDDYNYEYDDDN